LLRLGARQRRQLADVRHDPARLVACERFMTMCRPGYIEPLLPANPKEDCR